MNHILIKFKTHTIIAFLLLMATGCNKWLDVQPENDRTTNTFWVAKEEVEQVLMSCYTGLRDCELSFVLWGELRGDGIDLGTGYNADDEKIKKLDILPTNPVSNWNNIYIVIGRANSVIKYGPVVLEKDKTFSKELLNAYIAEATVLRSLCYFYLIRTFGDVPLVIEPYVDDSAPFNNPKSTEREVLDRIIKDLETVIPMSKPGFETTPSDNWQDKGRAGRWAAYALLADIYLWDGQYEKCKQACDKVIASGKYKLLKQEDWYSLFADGNTEESLFELQWRGSSQANTSLFNWYYGTSDKSRFVISEATIELYKRYATLDLRGFGATIATKEDNRIWKFAGTGINGDGGIVRPEAQRDANWIFYRYTDILLMRAEATVMLEEDQFSYAYNTVGELRTRAGYMTPLPKPQEKKEALVMVMEERQMELAAEGKRWFDILRFAKRNNYEYKDYLVDVLLKGVAAKDYLVWKSKLSDVNSYYLPILSDEIDANGGVLTQNPYYEGLE